MGRDKGPKHKASAKSVEPEAQEPPASGLCALCLKEVVLDEETHIVGHCKNSSCGSRPYHIPCCQEYLEKKLKKDICEGGFGTKAWEKVKLKIQQRPQELMYQKKVERDGGAQRLPQSCPACQAGLMESADVVKPVRKISAPPPVAAPRQPRGQAPAPAPAAKKAAPAAARPQAAGQSAKAALAGRLALGGSYANAGGGGNGGAPRRSMAPDPIPNRPVRLQLCRDGDDCRMYRCPFAHSPEEQAEREQEYIEVQREAQQRRRQAEAEQQARQQEAERRAAQRAAEAAAEAEALAAVRAAERQAAVRREAAEREEAALPLLASTLDLLKRHKRARCVEALSAMGFGEGAAAAAANAAGCEPEAAAGLLMEGFSGGGDLLPVSVASEARGLLAAAAAVGLGPPAVEAALEATAGDWERARSELQQTAAVSCAASTSGEASSAPSWGGAGVARSLSQASDASSSTALAAWPYTFQQPAVESSSRWSPSPTAAPPAPAAVMQPAPATFDAGFAAGMAAAMRQQQPQPEWGTQRAADQQPQQAQEWLAPEFERPPAPEEEVDALLAMLGLE